VVFFGKLYGIEDTTERARALLVDFGLEEAMNRQAKTFSRGMLQRLGLARALIGEPKMVLLDEPFTGLDRASTRTVIDRIHVLRNAGAIVLMISHDMETTAELADEIAVLVRGQLAHHHRGKLTADQVREHYAMAAEGGGKV
jgi:heme exporter protein A